MQASGISGRFRGSHTMNDHALYRAPMIRIARAGLLQRMGGTAGATRAVTTRSACRTMPRRHVAIMKQKLQPAKIILCLAGDTPCSHRRCPSEDDGAVRAGQNRLLDAAEKRSVAWADVRPAACPTSHKGTSPSKRKGFNTV